MLNLADVKLLKTILAQQGLRPQKKLGQHFLINRQVLERLLEAAQLSPDDVIVEVGAGIGTITVELAKRVKKVYAVEIDKNLIPILKVNVKDRKNVKVVYADILKFKPTAYTLSPKACKVIGAIPYQITSPLIHHLLTQENLPSLIAIIVQKEMAEKICAQPPKATYLSNFVGFFGKTEIVGKPIPPSAFWPQPDVHSSILKITQHPKISLSVSHPRPPRSRLPSSCRRQVGQVAGDAGGFLSFSVFLHKGFSHPRKMLKAVFGKNLLTAIGISPTRRAQTLTKQEWLNLFQLKSL